MRPRRTKSRCCPKQEKPTHKRIKTLITEVNSRQYDNKLRMLEDNREIYRQMRPPSRSISPSPLLVNHCLSDEQSRKSTLKNKGHLIGFQHCPSPVKTECKITEESWKSTAFSLSSVNGLQERLTVQQSQLVLAKQRIRKLQQTIKQLSKPESRKRPNSPSRRIQTQFVSKEEVQKFKRELVNQSNEKIKQVQELYQRKIQNIIQNIPPALCSKCKAQTKVQNKISEKLSNLLSEFSFN